MIAIPIQYTRGVRQPVLITRRNEITHMKTFAPRISPLDTSSLLRRSVYANCIIILRKLDRTVCHLNSEIYTYSFNILFLPYSFWVRGRERRADSIEKLLHINCRSHAPQLLGNLWEWGPLWWVGGPASLHQWLPLRIAPCRDLRA